MLAKEVPDPMHAPTFHAILLECFGYDFFISMLRSAKRVDLSSAYYITLTNECSSLTKNSLENKTSGWG